MIGPATSSLGPLFDQALSPKERALQAFEEREGEWLERIRAAALEYHRATGMPITSDDVRGLIESDKRLAFPKWCSPNVMGQVFRKGGWRSVGFTNSKLPQANGNLIRQWVMPELLEEECA